MENLSRIVKIGSALGFIGGIVSLLCMVIFFEAEDSALTLMGTYLLIAVMFFALAGGLSKGGQWSWNVVLFMTFLTIGVIGMAVVMEVVDLYVGILLGAIGVLIVASLSTPSSKTWANRTRI